MPRSRQLVIHHDDLGGSHSANLAFTELVDLGRVTCGSVMVPAPWFPEMVEIAHQRPDLDIGVHLTLTSEFSRYRWRPLTGGTSLVDPLGFFWPDLALARTADVQEVYLELKAQVDNAIMAGIDVTHLDSHMGTVWQPEFVDIYLQLGEEYRLPIVITRDVQMLSAPHDDLDRVFSQLQARGNPEFRKFLTTSFGNASPTAQDYREIFADAIDGLNWCGFHFAKSADIEGVTSDASTRIAEYEVFRSGEKVFPDDCELVGMRTFRDAMRSR